MSYLLNTISNNKARSLKKNTKRESPELTCGVVSTEDMSKPTIIGEGDNTLKMYDIKTKHLIMVLLNALLGREGFDESLHPDYYLVVGNSKVVAELLNISPRSASRGIKGLVDDKTIEELGSMYGHKLLGIRKDVSTPHYNKYAIPLIAVIADVPISFKKFLLKAHMCTESNTNKSVVLKNASTIRQLTSGNGYHVKDLLSTLDTNGWLEREGSFLTIDLEQIYSDLSNRRFYNETLGRMNKQ